MRTTRTPILLSAIAAMTVAAAACSAPDAPPPAATTAEAPAASTADAPGQSPASPAVQPGQATALNAPAPRPEPVRAPPPPPKPKVAKLAAGQVFTIRTTGELSTKSAKNGEVFAAVLEEPINVDGWVVAATGAKVDGRIVEVDKGGRIKGKANLAIELTSFTTSDGQKIDIVTSPVNTDAEANKGKDVAKVGIGAGAGAGIGAIAGGGKGAAIGAAVGAGVGALMRGADAVIPAETVVGFELRSPVTVQEKKN